ncbi:MAG TPA: heavy metal-associated domain-containing protein [Fimbriimonadaceae bacterium]|nr:heavy metal-associated domain-containing protein [Fimbriimonadaceae bacterium]HRJ96921.1 heavy metal-associated domain-containing protein [Fimbriimonadaceae bacterium]
MPITLRIEGMTCENCVRHVRQALESVPGVERALVELDAGRAVVEGTPDPQDLVAAVEEEGYAAELVP